MTPQVQMRGRALQVDGRLLSATTCSRVPFVVYAVVAYLGAITIFGKGPTYLGYPPVFWAEAVLVLSLLWLVSRHGLAGMFIDPPLPLSRLVALFVFVGAASTAVFYPVWGLDAIRDAAIWYYGLFYFVGISMGSDEDLGGFVWRSLLVFWIAALLWGSADMLTGERLSESGPVIPWRGVSVLSNSSSEQREHMGIGAMIVLCTGLLSRWQALRLVLMPVALLGFALVVSSYGRGAKVGIGLGMAAVLIAGLGHGRQMSIPGRIAFMLIAGIIVVPIAAGLLDIDLAKATQFDRFAAADPNNLDGTAYWRQVWWGNLVHQVFTRNPLFGLGFGENLGPYNPFLPKEEVDGPWPVRAPHNFNVTVLTRMGLVGACLWAGILITGIGGLFYRLWRGSAGQLPYSTERREEIAVWLLMLIATWINASFGVLMEGPVLGVWFWFALGFATARARGTGQAIAPANHGRVRFACE